MNSSVRSKGNPVNIPEPECRMFLPFRGLRTTSGNATELGDASESPRKSFLFFLTTCILPGISLTGDREIMVGRAPLFEVSGVLLMALEKPRERFIFASGRTHNRIRSPR